MNTKSAIKHLEKCKITDDKYKYCKLNQTWDNIISLLQQGEKYKQMWEKLEHGIVYDDEGNYIYSWSSELIGHMHKTKREIEK